MTLLATPQVSTTDLGWSAADRWYVAFASDLPGGLRLSRVYDDAADVGLTLAGRGGQTIPLVLTHQEHNDDEVRWFDFTPARPADAARFAGLRVFND